MRWKAVNENLCVRSCFCNYDLLRKMFISAASGLTSQFTGKERDETGLDYFGARYLSSALGRWTSPDDPFADQHSKIPQTWNLYTYVRNNPLNMVDPNGTDALWIEDKDKGETKLVIPVHLTGKDANPGNISKIINRINNLTIKGTNVKVEAIATDTPIHGVLNEMDFSPGFDFKNYPSAGEGVDSFGGTEGHINSSETAADGAAAHDILHFAGIKEGYDEGPRDKNGNRTSKPKPGFDNKNIMTSRSGTELNEKQIEEAKKNDSTKVCTTQDGKTICK